MVIIGVDSRFRRRGAAIAFALATGSNIAGLTIPGSKRGTAAIGARSADKTGVPIEDGPLSLDMLRNWVPHAFAP